LTVIEDPVHEASSTPRSRLGAIGAPRESAFPAALRHTARVARLRRLITWGVGGIVAVVVIVLGIKSLSFLPIDLRFSHITMKGTRITIEQPKLIGYRKDGRPYELSARLGVQDISVPDRYELEEVKSRLDAGPDKIVLMTATKGLYDSKKDRADLFEGVRIFDDKSYDLRLSRATVDFAAHRLTSDEPATLKLNCCEVTGNTLELAQNEQRMTFVGDVHSVFYGEPDETAEQGR
jgi:lipopolysaccharide export system protein LptC